MTGTFKVNKINSSGFYVSELDYDPIFAGGNNPEGYFKMIIEPLCFDEHTGVIRRCRNKSGWTIEGEGYIIDGSLEEIDERVKYYRKQYRKYKYEHIIYQEVASLSV